MLFIVKINYYAYVTITVYLFNFNDSVFSRYSVNYLTHMRHEHQDRH